MGQPRTCALNRGSCLAGLSLFVSPSDLTSDCLMCILHMLGIVTVLSPTATVLQHSPPATSFCVAVLDGHLWACTIEQN